MPHHALNASVVTVRGGVLVSKHQAAVEDVERLVLHGTHVEVVHRHNVEQVLGGREGVQGIGQREDE
jgi:hypothetical protein